MCGQVHRVVARVDQVHLDCSGVPINRTVQEPLTALVVQRIRHCYVSLLEGGLEGVLANLPRLRVSEAPETREIRQDQALLIEEVVSTRYREGSR